MFRIVLFVDLTLACRSFTAANFSIWVVSLLAISIDSFCNVKAQRCKESGFFDSGQIFLGDTFRRTDTLTNCKISLGNKTKILTAIHLLI